MSVAPSASALPSTRGHPCNRKTLALVTTVSSYDSVAIAGAHVPS